LASISELARGENLFHHAMAIMHAPSYAKENESALRQDWPRIPLPEMALPNLKS
jgi:predicted helicase